MDIFRMQANTTTRGFTLIELLVVIAIIGILSAVVITSLNTARAKARVASAQAALKEIQTAMERLASDSGRYPSWSNNKSTARCTNGDEIYVNDNRSGLTTTDGYFPLWDGPYLRVSPVDPWGTYYMIDGDYNCGASTVGCNGTADSGNVSDVILSFGPNKTQNYGDGDDIVLVLCKR